MVTRTVFQVFPSKDNDGPRAINSISCCSLLSAGPASQAAAWPDAKNAANGKVCWRNAAAIQRIKCHLALQRAPLSNHWQPSAGMAKGGSA